MTTTNCKWSPANKTTSVLSRVPFLNMLDSCLAFGTTGVFTVLSLGFTVLVHVQLLILLLLVTVECGYIFSCMFIQCMYNTHTRLTALCLGLPGSAGTRKVKTNLDFTGARDSEWQWHQLGHMQVCTSLQTDNHASTPPLSLLQAGCPSCCPTNSTKALKAKVSLILNG